jgi:hypothetical protein
MGRNILNRGEDGRNALERASNQLYNSTGGILGRQFRLSKPWPQSLPNSKGFLPPSDISPTGVNDPNIDSSKLGKIKDWRGNLLDVDPNSDNYLKGFKTSDLIEKFELSSIFPKTDSELNMSNGIISNDFSPYSIRDIYKIFNDTSTDYFKHGIFIERQNMNDKSGVLYSTPEENNDPVIFGFDLIIDVEKSPLLNGSIDNFLNQFDSIEEINSKKKVYSDFKIQFIKLFKTQTNINIDTTNSFLLKNTGRDNINTISKSDQNDSISFGKKAYMSYYLQKIDGLKSLTESNGPDSFKYLVDYRKDKITLHFLEDVSLTMGTLSSLYKLLYWSKPNGKGIIPENLLRFDCKIIVSELRNFNRVKASNSRVDVVKDNLSRYVYELNECQFFFDSRPHEDSIDISKTTNYSDYSVSFDYKFSSSIYEKWNPTISRYQSYNDGGMWNSNGDQSIIFDNNGSKIFGNGYDRDFLIKNYTKSTGDVPTTNESEQTPQQRSKTNFEKFKESSKRSSLKLANNIKNITLNQARSQLQLVVNTQVALLNKSLNKVLNTVAGTRGIKPPLNVYTDSVNRLGQTNNRIFYDIRGELANFAGDSLSNILTGR